MNADEMLVLSTGGTRLVGEAASRGYPVRFTSVSVVNVGVMRMAVNEWFVRVLVRVRLAHRIA